MGEVYERGSRCHGLQLVEVDLQVRPRVWADGMTDASRIDIEYRGVVLASLISDIEARWSAASGHQSVIGTLRQCLNRTAPESLVSAIIAGDGSAAGLPDRLTTSPVALKAILTHAGVLARGEPPLGRLPASGDTPLLTSAFWRLGGGRGTPLVHQWAPLGREGREGHFPLERSRMDPAQARRHWQTLPSDLEALSRVNWDDFRVAASHLLALVEKYLWCLPAPTNDPVADVALSDHVRVTAAVASCLYRYHAANGTLSTASTQAGARFLLVAADLSGIQDYLYAIANVPAGGVARRLRARSFNLQLLAESVSVRILKTLDLPSCHVLMDSGGRAYLLLPNLPDVVATLKRMRTETDQWLIEHLLGEIGLNLAWIVIGDDAFVTSGNSGFGAAIGRLSASLGRRKHQRHLEILQDTTGWRADAFVRHERYGDTGSCPSCRKFAANPADPEGFCIACNRDANIGRVLPETVAVSFHERRPDGRDVSVIPLPGMWAKLEQAPGTVRSARVLEVLHLAHTNLDASPLSVVRFRPITTHVPWFEGLPLTFEDLANHAEGPPYLGYLKADADRLGEALRFGLRRENQPGYDTLARLVTISRQLDQFFSEWVGQMLVREFRDDSYTVYAGGDDIMVVAPWNVALSIANRIHEGFVRRTSGHLTISAGIAVVSRRVPLARATRMADDALEASKDEGRDRLTMLGATLPWMEWGEVEKVAAMFGREKPSSGLLQVLRRFGAIWREGRDPGRRHLSPLRLLPRLAYAASRHVDPRRTPELARFVEETLVLRPGTAGTANPLDHIEPAAAIALLRQRTGGRDA